MRPRYEVAQILRVYGDEFRKTHRLSPHQLKALQAIEICRTSTLGGHIERCDKEECGHERIAYNSCRNRHCPKCQATNRERWILARQRQLLHCKYFHVVFTVPQELNIYFIRYPREMYNLLFLASKETLMQFGNDVKHLGAQLGITSLLHTWGQSLSLHPHVHMIVPGGGIDKTGEWKSCKSEGKFLFPIAQLRVVYRGKFMAYFLKLLNEKSTCISVGLKRKLYDKKWVVYAKQPFGGPSHVIEYLGRYSHKVAISNHRIVKVENGHVTFKWKDYKHGNVTKLMTLKSEEFLRRFCLHILPYRFVKIRHYGFLASRNKLKLEMEQLKQGTLPLSNSEKPTYIEIAKEQLGIDLEQCPHCKTGRMITILQFPAHAPPFISHDKRQALKNSN